jgi:hypothetical protein
MTMLATTVGVRPAVAPGAVGRTRVDAGPPRPGVAGRAIAAVFLVLLVLGICGLAATGDLPTGGPTPPEGPAAGLDL